VSEGVSVFVGDTRVAGRVLEGVGVGVGGGTYRIADRVPLTLTEAAHAGRDTLVATAHASAHGHASRSPGC
jgi:hypothetical protein